MTTKTRLPSALADIPEKPEHGNYVCTGLNRWSHAESLSEAYRIWRRSLHSDTSTREALAGLVIVDVSDDFQIFYEDGSVTAGKGKLAFRQD